MVRCKWAQDGFASVNFADETTADGDGAGAGSGADTTEGAAGGGGGSGSGTGSGQGAAQAAGGGAARQERWDSDPRFRAENAIIKAVRELREQGVELTPDELRQFKKIRDEHQQFSKFEHTSQKERDQRVWDAAVAARDDQYNQFFDRTGLRSVVDGLTDRERAAGATPDPQAAAAAKAAADAKAAEDKKYLTPEEWDARYEERRNEERMEEGFVSALGRSPLKDVEDFADTCRARVSILMAQDIKAGKQVTPADVARYVKRVEDSYRKAHGALSVAEKAEAERRVREPTTPGAGLPAGMTRDKAIKARLDQLAQDS